MEHLGTKTLETERLILRQLTKATDAQAIFDNWASDPEVTKYLMWKPHESVEVTKKYFGDRIPRYEEKDFYSWGIILKEYGDNPVGTIAVVEKDDEIRMVHIGYALGRVWWNQGIMSEAFARVIKFFFEEVKLNRIESRHDPNNPGSGRVMMKCGLKYEGTKREADWNNQGICDAALYAILERDYFA